MSPGKSRSSRSGVALARIAAVSRSRVVRQSIRARSPCRVSGDPRGTGDLLDRRVEEGSRHREVRGDDVGQVGHLRRGQPDQLGQRQEQRQSQARQGVPVDRRAGPVPRCREALVAQPGSAVPGDRGGHLEVDQGDPVVRPDHDVEQVQVPVDQAALVDRRHDGFDLLVDLAGPPGVRRPVAVRRVGVDQRVPVDQHLVQRSALDELQREELVLAERELVVHPRHLRQVGELPQGLRLAGQPGDGVGAVGVQAGVRSGLLQHHRGVGTQVPAHVQPAAVGEVDHPLDPVRHLVGAGSRSARPGAGRGSRAV